MAHDPSVALEILVSLGFQRVLTSGCDPSALEGLPLIKRLIDQVSVDCMYAHVCMQASEKGMTIYLLSPPVLPLIRRKGGFPSCQVSAFLCMQFMRHCFVFFLIVYTFFLNAGGGITERNLQRILEGSGAQEFHCSARSSKDSAMKFRYV